MKKTEYIYLIEYLFTRITYATSQENLNELSAILQTLKSSLSNQLEEEVVLELWLWLGLKLDESPKAAGYGNGIVQDYPEYFPKLRTYTLDPNDIYAEEVLAESVSITYPNLNHKPGEFTITPDSRATTGKVRAKA